MKRDKAIRLLLVALVLMLSISVPALAKSDTVIESDSLTVNVIQGGETVWTKEYSLDELQDLSDGTTVFYSSVDRMPARVLTVAKGVYISDLLDDVSFWLEEDGLAIDAGDFYRLRLYASYDNWSSTAYSVSSLLGDRYYYAGLFETDTFAALEGEDWTVDADEVFAGYAEEVSPMLALSSWQARTESTSGSHPLSTDECLRFCIGQKKSDITGCVSTTSDYGRGVDRIDITMDSGAAPINTTPTGITLSHSRAELAIGNMLQLSADLIPNTATGTIDWSSSNLAVASVSSNGLVTAQSVGSAIITATVAGYSQYTASCTVTVANQAVAITGISINKSTASVLIDKTTTLKATVTPYNATYDAIQWRSSNQNVATVKDGVVSGIKPGEATITATVDGYSASCQITVLEENIPVTGLSFEQTRLVLTLGGQAAIVPIIEPENATEDTLLWSSDSPGVVRVDTQGNVTALGVGTATITAVTDDGGYEAKCLVTVNNNNSRFSDISGHWAEESINTLVEAGLIDGYQDGTFRPDATITRAEFVTILVRALQKNQGVVLSGGNYFHDTASHWAKEYVSTAVALGITSGYGNGYFGSNDLIQRQQMAVMLVKAFGFGAGSDLDFKDSGTIASWARDGVAAAFAQGVISGYTDQTFRPTNSATRGEAATMIVNTLRAAGKL